MNIKEISDDELITELFRRTGNGNILACKVWTKEDIKKVAKTYLEKDLTEKEVNQIAEEGDFDYLSDCQDFEYTIMAEKIKEFE